MCHRSSRLCSPTWHSLAVALTLSIIGIGVASAQEAVVQLNQSSPARALNIAGLIAADAASPTSRSPGKAKIAANQEGDFYPANQTKSVGSIPPVGVDFMATGEAAKPPPLPAEQAFALHHSFDQNSQILALYWDIAPGYYMYHDRLAVREPSTPKDENFALVINATPVNLSDEYFGDTTVYYSNLDVKTDLSAALGNHVDVHWQGCSEIHKLCYPPQNIQINLRLAASGSGASGADKTVLPASGVDSFFQDNLNDSGGILLVIALMYLAGLALSFTPCVLPMVPVLSGIIGGNHRSGASSRLLFLLGLTYVLSMALTYSLFGVIIALTGQFFQAFIQHPVVIVCSVVVVVLMGLWMIGVLHMRLFPGLSSTIQNWQSRLSGGRFWTAILAGIFSSLIVSPCISAPLVAALVFISQTGNWVLGGSALLALGLGMGTPLMLVCLGMQQLLPRAGTWMNSLNHWLGVGLVLVALWLLERIIPFPAVMLLLFALLVASAVAEGALDFSQERNTRGKRLYHGFVVLVLLYALALGVGLLRGQTSLLHPLASSGGGGHNSQLAEAPQSLDFRPVRHLDELNTVLNKGDDRVTMLDVYADWCISCKELEHKTFTDPRVSSQMAKLSLLRLDVTDFDPEHQKLFRHFGLYGPPALLFFDTKGREIRRLRQNGFVEPDVFLSYLDAALKTSRR